MIIIAARPAIGKSTLALDFARSAGDQAQADDGDLLAGNELVGDHDALAEQPKPASNSTTSVRASWPTPTGSSWRR